jgi:parallel beta-helix repeat protein
MKRKCLAVGIILLFIGAAIIPAIAQDIERSSTPTSRGHWLYVGGSGPGNYTTIGAAYNNATDGDTIFVYPGVYVGGLEVYKSLTFIGAEKNTTILKTWEFNNLLRLEKGITSISGFTIDTALVGIWIPSNDNVISNNIITNCHDYGIALWGSQNIIQNNIFLNDQGGAISGTYSSALTIENNSIYNCGYGISLSTSSGMSWIRSNNIHHNSIGVYLDTYSATVSNNNIYSNGLNAKFHQKIGGYLDQIWANNYWGNNNSIMKIRGSVYILLRWATPDGWQYFRINFPWREFDYSPAQKPYDVPGMS